MRFPDLVMCSPGASRVLYDGQTSSLEVHGLLISLGVALKTKIPPYSPKGVLDSLE